MAVKRHKPSREAIAATHSATDEDYQRLAKIVVEHIVHKKRDICIRFPYFAKLPDDWPRGILYHRDESYNYFRCKTFKVANWLYDHNHLPQDSKGIVKSMRSVVNLVGEIDRLLNKPLTAHADEGLLCDDKIFVDSDE